MQNQLYQYGGKMKKVITYGTYDWLHYGHIRLLKRAKELGDYLIVGVTADDFDKSRGKINVQQSLSSRIEAVRLTGIADEIIVEEYEGQKIDDIRKYNIDTFTVGSDWIGTFDYLKEYCNVVYLDRTEGISSSEIRKKKSAVRIGLVGDSPFLNRFEAEVHYVNGITLTGICTNNIDCMSENIKKLPIITESYQTLLDSSDAVYIHSHPTLHYEQIKLALQQAKHVLCEAPISLSKKEYIELYELAKEKGCILTDALRTAYATAYSRLILLIKSGHIGKVISVDAVCTSLKNIDRTERKIFNKMWNSITAWGPTALLPVFQILGTQYNNISIISHIIDVENQFDTFSKVEFVYSDAVASVKIGNGVKSEGELIISGTNGYIYVPAPWWKTDYFEIRYENPAENKRYFYQLDGEGIRYELFDFVKSIENSCQSLYIDEEVTEAIIGVMEMFEKRQNLIEI